MTTSITGRIRRLVFTQRILLLAAAVVTATLVLYYIALSRGTVPEWEGCTGFAGPISPKPKKYPVCMITRVRNYAEWLPEWIEYYNEFGAAKIFIADDCSDDNGATKKILEYYRSLGIVEPYYEYDAHPCGEKWVPNEDYLISWTFKRAKAAGCDWIGLVDADEFMVYITPEWQNTTSMLPYLSQSLLPFVKLMWMEMSTEGKLTKGKGLTIESSHNLRSPPYQSKTFIRADAIYDWRFSHYSEDWERQLRCLLGPAQQLVLPADNFASHDVILPDGSSMRMPTAPAALKHFVMRSLEEFHRGRGKNNRSSSNGPNIYANNTGAWGNANFISYDPSARFTSLMAQLVRARLKSRTLPNVPFLPILD